MRRGVVTAVIVAAVVLVMLIVLAGRSGERPMTRIEQTIPDNALSH